MFAAAATNLSVAIGAGTVLVGIIGAILAILRFKTDEEGKRVTQQAQIVVTMQGLNDELGDALERARQERDQWRTEATGLRDETAQLRAEVALLRAELARLNQRLGEEP